MTTAPLVGDIVDWHTDCDVKPYCVLSHGWEVVGDWKEAGQDSAVVSCA